MRIKEGFVLRNVADSWIVVPIGERVVEFNGLISLNDTGAFLWKLLEQKIDQLSTLVDEMMKHYEVDDEVALSDTQEFISLMQEKGLLEL